MTARGELIRSGAPLVKNVTGFDLCRLLVGSLGTLALLGEVVLRCRPRPEVEALVGRARTPTRSRLAGRAVPAAVGPVGRQPHLGRAWPATRPTCEDQADGRARAAVPARSTGPPAPPGAAIRRSPAARGPCARAARARPAVPGGWLAGRGRRRGGALHAGGGRPAGARPGRRRRPWSTCTGRSRSASTRTAGSTRAGPSLAAGRRDGAAPVDGPLGVDADDLAACVSCGLCLAHCPTYRVTGEEGLSPRGRIAAMRAVDAGRRSDATFARLMQTCVQCRACETACPSSVPFGRLMEGARAAAGAARRCRAWQRAALPGPRPPPGCWSA